jgi:hypothetical protein
MMLTAFIIVLAVALLALLLVHGAADEVNPFKHGERLAAASR